MSELIDFKSLLALYDRNESNFGNLTLREHIRQNAGVITAVVGGTGGVLEAPLSFDPRAEYWYQPQRRFLVAYGAKHWWGRWKQPVALRRILLRTAQHLEAWHAGTALRVQGVDYDAVGGWGAVVRALREPLRSLPDMPEWAEVVHAPGQKKRLPASFREHILAFLDGTEGTAIEEVEPAFGLRLSMLPYCGAVDEPDLARRAGFWFNYAHALMTTNSYRTAGSQIFAPILQNTPTDVFIAALRRWRDGKPGNEQPVLALDARSEAPRDRSGYSAIIEVWGMLNVHRAPFYNSRAEEYRNVVGDELPADSDPYRITLAIGEKTRRWVAANDEARRALASIAERELVGAYPDKPFVMFEARDKSHHRLTRESFAPGAIDLEHRDALIGRARKWFSARDEIECAALALHLLLDAHIYKRSLEERAALGVDEDEDDEGTAAAPASQGGAPRDALEAAILNPRLWLYAPGDGAEYWEHDLRDGIAAIGWDELGDLSQYETKAALEAAIVEQYSRKSRPINDTSCCWAFAHQMKAGDTIIARRGRTVIIGVGRITSDYRFDDSRGSFMHVRTVSWLWHGEHGITGRIFPIKTITNISHASEIRRQLAEMTHVSSAKAEARISDIEGGGTGPEPYSIDDALEDLFLDRDEVQHLLALLQRKKNIVLQGPPGVGKTFVAQRLAYLLMNERDEGRSAFVQFHQAYTYEAFVQGFRPSAGGGFELRSGPFLELVGLALDSPDEPHVLIIDEINRGNLGKILGELMMLIEPDKRDPKWGVQLAHSDKPERFHVPANIHIIGTMNTADRSLAVVDYALRRRFVFVQLAPAWRRQAFAEHLLRQGVSAAALERVRGPIEAINAQICEDPQLGRGFEIGHSYFCEVPKSVAPDAWIDDVIRYEIVPLLEEYWFDAERQLAQAKQQLPLPSR